MIGFWNDVRHAARVLLKTPGFAAAAIIVLALGIGANTAIFSIVNGMLLRPLPYPDADRLVQLWHTPPQKQFPGLTQFALSAANYLDWKEQSTVLDASAAYRSWEARLTGSGEAQILRGARVEPAFFSVLGTQPLLGRTIVTADGDTGDARVIVLSHDLWATQFGSDRQIVGRNVNLNGEAYTVVGVMPPAFQKPAYATLWTPLIWTPQEKSVRGEHSLSAIARLKPGVSVAQAQSQLNTIAARIDGIKPTIVGIGIGAIAAVWVNDVLATLIYGVNATDVPTFAARRMSVVGVRHAA